MLISTGMLRTTTRRDATIEEFIPLVKRVVGRLSRRIPDSMDRDSLEGAGLIGLIQAVDHFDADKGVPFETYARIRIKGAVQDELRTLDHLTRDQRKLVSSVVEARDKLVKTFGRPVDEDEIAAAANLTLEEVRQGTLQQARPQALDPSVVDETVTGTLWQEQRSAEHQVTEREQKDLLQSALSLLPERDQMVMSLYYEEGLNLAEIGDILDVSQSRVSQIIGKIKRDLRAKLAGQA